VDGSPLIGDFGEGERVEGCESWHFESMGECVWGWGSGSGSVRKTRDEAEDAVLGRKCQKYSTRHDHQGCEKKKRDTRRTSVLVGALQTKGGFGQVGRGGGEMQIAGLAS